MPIIKVKLKFTPSQSYHTFYSYMNPNFFSLSERKSLKRSIQRTQKQDSLSASPGPDLALACDRSLIHSSSSTYRSLCCSHGCTLTRDLATTGLSFWCGDGAFKAATKLWTQLYTIHGLKNGYAVPYV